MNRVMTGWRFAVAFPSPFQQLLAPSTDLCTNIDGTTLAPQDSRGASLQVAASLKS
eukprot:COSAG02_NODE_33431_length_500_cov_0.820449_1_plen_55_part_10